MISRRAGMLGLAGLVGAMTFSGAPAFAPVGAAPMAVGRRLVVLDWSTAEALIAIGIRPLAIAELDAYRRQVVGSGAAEGTLDVGMRGQPNLELIEELAPDLVLLNTGQAAFFGARFGAIAPLLVTNMYAAGTSPFVSACAETRRLAKEFGVESAAETLIEGARRDVGAAKASMERQGPAPLFIVQFIDRATVRVFGRRSLFDEIMQMMGLANAWAGETNRWGYTTTTIAALATATNAGLVCVEPVPADARAALATNSLWLNLPCVSRGRVVRVPPVWNFGGVPTAARLARLLSSYATRFGRNGG